MSFIDPFLTWVFYTTGAVVALFAATLAAIWIHDNWNRTRKD